MKRGFFSSFFIIILLLLSSPLYADRIGALNSEEDGTPGDAYAYKYVWPNGTLSCTDGVCTFTPTFEGPVSMGGAVFIVTAHGTPALDTTEVFYPGVSTVTVVNNFVVDFAGWPAAGNEGKVTVYMTNGGTATITWDGAIIWSGGTPPTLTAAGKDVLVFITFDGGTTVYGFVSGMDMK